MYDSLRGKTALIFGGTSGIGRTTANALARNGSHVVFTGRRPEAGTLVERELRAAGVKATFVRGDVSDEAHIRAAVDAAVNLNGRLDLAFNNAGIELGGVETADATPEQYQQVFNTNVLGVLLGLKHEIRAMRKSGSGAIVNTTSVAASIGIPGAGIYIASKHAVLGLTRTAALEVAGSGIRVNCVSPGAIQTEMFDRFTGGKPEAVNFMTSLHPLGRVGKVDEVAAAVLFLLSDQAAFITGHDLKIDGGLTVP